MECERSRWEREGTLRSPGQNQGLAIYCAMFSGHISGYTQGGRKGGAELLGGCHDQGEPGNIPDMGRERENGKNDRPSAEW
jgi:hypothetical protein